LRIDKERREEEEEEKKREMYLFCSMRGWAHAL